LIFKLLFYLNLTIEMVSSLLSLLYAVFKEQERPSSSG